MASAPPLDHVFTREHAIDRVLREQAIESAYQPLVDLYSGATIGFEALARGPKGTVLARPDALFAAAERAGLEREVEWECQRAAFQGALDARLGDGRALFVNVEPRLLSDELPAELSELAERATAAFPVFVEFTERSLTDRPAQLLAAAERLRAQGIGIALDDLGVDARSLALMPVLAPDVIKLDLRLVQRHPTREVAAIVHAVNAEAERTGAQLLAEGIETDEQRRTAMALGARYGQGWLFGRPGPLTIPTDTRAQAPEKRAWEPPAEALTPFELVVEQRPTRRGTKRLLLALSRQIEAQAPSLGSSAVILASFQEAAFFTPDTAARYREMASGAALVGALGVGLSERPAPGVRGVALAPDDPLRGEWNVVAIGPHFAAAFVARDLGDSGPDMERQFDFALTYDRSLAVAVATSMIKRLAPLDPRS